MARGFVYLTAVVDLVSRRMLAQRRHHLGGLPCTQGHRAGRRAPRQSNIVNNDPTNWLAAFEFADAVLGQGCQLSRDGRGAWRASVSVERPWRSVKYAQVRLKAYASVNHARTDFAEYVGGYNAGREHANLAAVTPEERCFPRLSTLMAMAA